LNYLKIPLFLVLAADLLQLFINDAFFQGLITLPLDRSYGQDCPIVQYADDTNHPVFLILAADLLQSFINDAFSRD
jgi:hypothetical protein